MSRESTLVLLGALIVLSPFSGFPLSWLMWFLPVVGLLVVGIALSLKLERMRRAQRRALPLDEATPATS